LKKHYTYSAFGLIISSEIEIPEFVISKEKSNVTICYGNVPKTLKKTEHEGFRYQISKNEFLIKYSTWATYFVCNGEKVIIQPEKNADERDIRAFILSTVIAIVLHQRGLLPLHTSGIVYKNKGVLFAGNSGIGKSTIAIALNKKYKYKFISDDITVISEQNAAPIIYSSFPSVKLWQDSLDMLKISNNKLPLIRKDVNKFRYNTNTDFYSGILNPYAIFVIENNVQNKVEIIEIKGVEKFNIVRNHIFRAKMIKELYSNEHFKLLTLFLNSAKCYKILRPKDVNTINELSSMINNIIKKVWSFGFEVSGFYNQKPQTKNSKP